MPEPGFGSEQPDAVTRVRLVAELIPPGRVASYGDLGAIVGVGPRQVGAVMRDHSEGVPWWRVVAHDGVLQPLPKARTRWAEEGIAVRPDGRGCRIAEYRVDLSELALEYRAEAASRGWTD